MGHLNINSIRNKFELFLSLIGGKIDILMISETKLDATFPTNLFFIRGYSTVYRLDWSDKVGGIICQRWHYHLLIFTIDILSQ